MAALLKLKMSNEKEYLLRKNKGMSA